MRKVYILHFSHITFDVIKDNNLKSRVKNCRQLSTNTFKKLFEIEIRNDYTESENNHVVLLLGIEKQIYFLDPLCDKNIQ